MTTTLRQTSEAPSPGATDLAASYIHCRDLTKRAAANFYFGMKLLPEPKRSAMYALYAYMRLVDDIADDDANVRTVPQRRADLDQWEQLTRQAVEGADDITIDSRNPVIAASHAIWPAFADMARTYKIPLKIFEDMIAGQRQDLETLNIQTFDDLYQYCYRVASVVGIASLYVWGFDGGEETLELSAQRGIAYQLTNILRDLREDQARGRCYLPTEELSRWQVRPDNFSHPNMGGSEQFLSFMDFQIQRARSYYEKSAPLESRIQPDSRPTLIAMTAIYRGILEKIAANPASVLRKRVRLSTLSKLLIGWRAMRAK